MQHTDPIAKKTDDLFARRGLTIIAGPCVIESLDLCRTVAEKVAGTCDKLGLPYIFKSSFDKANRTSSDGFRGPGIEGGLRVLETIRDEFETPVLTDFHHPEQAALVAEVADVLQVPAFLCRQTDMIVAAAKTGKPTFIKKGQFVAPLAMRHPVEKFHHAARRENGDVAIVERGTSFGYGDLIVDMRGIVTMREDLGVPVIFDATHSVQQPTTGTASFTSGARRFAPALARAAIAIGIDGLFCEVHPSPDDALCDAANTLSLSDLKALLQSLSASRSSLPSPSPMPI